MNKFILSILVFFLLELSSLHDAFGAITCRDNTTGARACTNNLVCPTGWTKISNSCSTQTVGGSITYISHHDQVIKCTWEEYQGDWLAEPGPPISVSQLVEGQNNYATCSGWDKDTPVTQLPPGTASVPVGHSGAPYGFGKFFFKVNYSSATPLTCIEDANAGIGNNCTKTSDAQNPKHNSGSSTTPGASLACANNSGGGTTLTYQFACADGVSVTGFLTLVPAIGGVAQTAPLFTGPCSPERVAAGKCTMQLGGIPSKTVKIKGQNVTVVDSDACLAAFPSAQVINAFNSNQTQTLDPKELLFYKEVASEGSCNTTTKLPTVPGLPAAAYGRYCQSDLGLFSDNQSGNFFATDPLGEGFDNELRVCPTGPSGTSPHTAAQDVEQASLTNGVRIEPQGTLNLNCTTGGNTDSGGYTVKIPDQAPLLSIDIDRSPLSEAPKLEDIAPTSASIIVDTDGVRKLSLRYPTCSAVVGQGLSANIINRYHPTNNSDVTLTLKGQTNGAGAGSLGPIQFDGQFTIKVNGL